MKFGPVPVEQAVGRILGHHITRPDGSRAFRKGKPLTAGDVALLAGMGRKMVYVAELEAGDVVEDVAAGRIAAGVMGQGLRLSAVSTGRVNLHAALLGVLRVNQTGLLALNQFEGVTLATLPSNMAVTEGRMVATIKILPYALPESVVAPAGAVGPILWLTPLQPRRVSLILSGSPAAQERVRQGFGGALRRRLAALGSELGAIDFVPLEDEGDEAQLAQTIQQQLAAGCELLILAGETAIMDRYDIAPRAVERAGGEIVCFGAPVDPGNLLMLAYAGKIPILGAPGCVRSPKENIVDLLLPRLLVGDRPGKAEIIGLGYGGLLEDVPERPAPRSQL